MQIMMSMYRSIKPTKSTVWHQMKREVLKNASDLSRQCAGLFIKNGLVNLHPYNWINEVFGDKEATDAARVCNCFDTVGYK